MTTHIYTHPSCLAHDTGSSHPECIERLRTLMELFAEEHFSTLPVIEAGEADLEWILRAHSENYVFMLEESVPASGHYYIDGDTIISPGSWIAALHAAGAVCQAVSDVAAKKCDNAFCPVRPPGHHAIPDKAMGFCLLGNVFIAARYAQEELGLKRIAIIDFDVHHGNGTDFMIRKAEDIFYISSHQYPWYPGTGDPAQDIPDKIMSLPLAAGTGSAEFRAAYEAQAFPALERFKPDMILISAGFDAHKDDPLGGLNLVEDDYAWITGKLMDIAARHCSGKIVSALEGGYNLEALKSSVAAHLRTLATL